MSYSNVRKIGTNRMGMRITVSSDDALEKMKGLAKAEPGKKNEDIRDEAINTLFKDEYVRAVSAEGLDPVSAPEVEVLDEGKKNEIVFDVKVYVRPQVSVSYKGLTATIKKHAVTDEEVERAILEGLARHMKETEITDRPAQDGDVVTFDYKGFCGGEQFEGGTAENQQLVLGSGMFIPGFEDQMIGKKIGEPFTVEVTFPENYPAPNLAGKPATFECLIHAIKVQEIPELNEAFVKEYAGCDDVETYRRRARNHVQQMADLKAEEDALNDLLEQVIEKLDAEIPEVMIENETDQVITEFAGYLEAQGATLEKYLENTNQTPEQFREQVRPDALHRVKMSLAVGKIALEEKVVVTDEEFRMAMGPTAAAYGVTVDELLEKSNKDRLMQIKSSLLIKKTMYAVLGYADRKEITENA